MNNKKIHSAAQRTLRIEAEAIMALSGKLDKRFDSVVEAIYNCPARLVVSGIGKSAIVAQKIVATFNSTGTAALFMHAADALHGDLGSVQKKDLVMLISKSGASPEVKALVPMLKSRGNKIIGMTAEAKSYLAQNSDYLLHTPVKQEACPNNLAPTTSTTLQMAVGDALAVCLMELRGFGADDFARSHPGGALGKQLYLSVHDASLHNAKPVVTPEAPVKDVIIEISSKRLGATAVVKAGILKGVITDGDIRRMMERTQDISRIKAKDIMNTTPKTIEDSELAVKALQVMKENNINQLVVTHNKKYAGMVHILDLLKEGLF